MLCFAVDPVAVDSVMFDYLVREGEVNPAGYIRLASEDILVVVAEAGLGVHERWNNDSDRAYTAIDYVEIDLDDNPDQGNDEASGEGGKGCLIEMLF